MTTDKQYDFMEVMEALKDLRNQYENGKPLVWNGPDDLHSSVSATAMPPSWHFTDEGLNYALENDLDFWDVYTAIAFQIGFSNGAVREGERVKLYEESSDTWKRLYFELKNEVEGYGE